MPIQPYKEAEKEFQLKYLRDMVHDVNPDLRVDIYGAGGALQIFTVAVYREGERDKGITVQEYDKPGGMGYAIAAIERTFSTCPEFYKR